MHTTVNSLYLLAHSFILQLQLWLQHMLGTCTVYVQYCNFVDDIPAIAKEQTRESINQSINP